MTFWYSQEYENEFIPSVRLAFLSILRDDTYMDTQIKQPKNGLAVVSFVFACVVVFFFALQWLLMYLVSSVASVYTWINTGSPVLVVLTVLNSLVSNLLLPAVVPLSIVSIQQIKKNPEAGRRLAFAALIIVALAYLINSYIAVRAYL